MSNMPISEIESRVTLAGEQLNKVVTEFSRVVVGQEELRLGLLSALLCNGHVLIEGVPGLAKTLAAYTLSRCISGTFSRIQFTPDLMPADITGTMIYQQHTGEFVERMGPIFAQLILADEINRAPAKVQSALLEAMQERQVTFGGTTHPLPKPFFVMATQNPIEQEGTYPLPEAQVDRFLMKLKVDYPTVEEEKEILQRMGGFGVPPAEPVITPGEVLGIQNTVNCVIVEPEALDYAVRLVDATRNPKQARLKDLENLITVGASPRGSLSLIACARAMAVLSGQAFVTPDLIKEVAPAVLRHRIIRSFEAEAEQVSVEQIIRAILDKVPVGRR
jgi:MoxR-like ATPase